MTEAQWDTVHQVVGDIWHAVHKLVDNHTEDVDPDVDNAIRQKLTEDFRFWRRPQ